MSGFTSNVILDPPRLESGRAARLELAGKAIAGLGGLLAVAAALVDTKRFAFSYLTGFGFVVTLALGALFFILLQHLTRAGWSVGPRRQMEWIASSLPLIAALFIPVALLGSTIWQGWMGPEAAQDHLIHQKHAYLNPVFFYVRAAIYFAAWIGIARYFTATSSAQDLSGDVELTRRMQARSAPAMLVFGLTTTFAGFDWLMTLDPAWYSTIFGVYVFAGAVVGSLAALALITVALQRFGVLRTVSTVEHRHDIGKLLFGFTVFYAYISFSQYFLIWYADIPEETVFYQARWTGSWQWVSLALIALHFVVPFVLLLSRAGKRSAGVLALAAAVLLVGHYIDLYWLVMPTIDKAGAQPSWIDLAGLLGPVGMLAWWLSMRAARDRLYPVRDPRLGEAVRLENV